MIDLLLNINILFSWGQHLLTMGLPAIDDSLDGILSAMKNFNLAGAGTLITYSKVLGQTLCICVGGYECWMMILGRRGIDVIKILRIIGISLCITSIGWIRSAISVPGDILETQAKVAAKVENKKVAALELAVAKKQGEYYDKLRAKQDSIEAKKVAASGIDTGSGTIDKILYYMSHMNEEFSNLAKQAAVVTETKISEWTNDIIRFIGELVFQMSYYGMLCAQRIFLSILGIFGPVAFALSLAPPWSSAWSQWLSKYISLTLWGFVIYTIVSYVDQILIYNLTKDLIAYTRLCGSSGLGSWSSVGALGAQGIGSNCMYSMGMLVGAFVLRFTPEVASWLIPGGASSAVGGAMGTAAMGASSAVGGTMGVAKSMGSAFSGNSKSKKKTKTK